MRPRWLVCLFLLAYLPACDVNHGQQMEALQKEIQKTVEDTQKAIEGLRPKKDKLQTAATSEVEKLFTFEYKIAEFESTLEQEELEKEMKALGEGRWDCFHVEPLEKKLRFFCKRRPKTYLRYIPRVF